MNAVASCPCLGMLKLVEVEDSEGLSAKKLETALVTRVMAMVVPLELNVHVPLGERVEMDGGMSFCLLNVEPKISRSDVPGWNGRRWRAWRCPRGF